MGVLLFAFTFLNWQASTIVFIHYSHPSIKLETSEFYLKVKRKNWTKIQVKQVIQRQLYDRTLQHE
jgi:hypothetical protein